MDQNRRDFLKKAGLLATVAATGGLTVAEAQAKPPQAQACGMARGLTLLTMQRNGEYRLGVKTDKGILDVPEAAKLLKMQAPGSMDELLTERSRPQPKCTGECCPQVQSRGKSLSQGGHNKIRAGYSPSGKDHLHRTKLSETR